MNKEELDLDDDLVQAIKGSRTISSQELLKLAEDMDVKAVYVFGVSSDGAPVSHYRGLVFEGVADFLRTDVSAYLKDAMSETGGGE